MGNEAHEIRRIRFGQPNTRCASDCSDCTSGAHNDSDCADSDSGAGSLPRERRSHRPRHWIDVRLQRAALRRAAVSVLCGTPCGRGSRFEHVCSGDLSLSEHSAGCLRSDGIQTTHVVPFHGVGLSVTGQRARRHVWIHNHCDKHGGVSPTAAQVVPRVHQGEWLGCVRGVPGRWWCTVRSVLPSEPVVSMASRAPRTTTCR